MSPNWYWFWSESRNRSANLHNPEKQSALLLFYIGGPAIRVSIGMSSDIRVGVYIGMSIGIAISFSTSSSICFGIRISLAAGLPNVVVHPLRGST